MKLISLDPGGTTGWALFEDNRLRYFGKLQKDEVMDWLNNQRPDVYVVEDYKIFPQKGQRGYSHNWSTPFAVEILGALKLICQVKKIELVKQMSSIKPAGYGFCGMTYVKGKKGMHIQDAIAHGAYYLVKKKGVNPKCLTLPTIPSNT